MKPTRDDARPNELDMPPAQEPRVPEWAEEVLHHELPDDTHLLNARTIERGRFKGAVLANTTRGAVLLTKTTLGEPVVNHLPLPDEIIQFRCTACGNRMELHDVDAPRTVYCSQCATPFAVARDGRATRADTGAAPARVAAPAPSHGARLRALEDATRDGDGHRAPGPPTPLETRIVDTEPAPPARSATRRGPHRHGPYTLYKRDVGLQRGATQTIYFFARGNPKNGTPSAMPDGYEVIENDHTGLPFLRKVGAHAEDEPYRPQCAAITADGLQCRNSAREASKYCAPHRGYRPPRRDTVDWTRDVDTEPRVVGAEDTSPSLRAR